MGAPHLPPFRIKYHHLSTWIFIRHVSYVSSYSCIFQTFRQVSSVVIIFTLHSHNASSQFLMIPVLPRFQTLHHFQSLPSGHESSSTTSTFLNGLQNCGAARPLNPLLFLSINPSHDQQIVLKSKPCSFFKHVRASRPNIEPSSTTATFLNGLHQAGCALPNPLLFDALWHSTATGKIELSRGGQSHCVIVCF